MSATENARFFAEFILSLGEAQNDIYAGFTIATGPPA